MFLERGFGVVEKNKIQGSQKSFICNEVIAQRSAMVPDKLDVEVRQSSAPNNAASLGVLNEEEAKTPHNLSVPNLEKTRLGWMNKS
jgi:hypothetical protein